MTTILLVTLVVCFVLQFIVRGYIGDRGIDNFLALSVNGLKRGWIWQLITFQFLHAGLLHLLGNMLGLYFFGRAVEEVFGSRRMLALYLLSGSGGGLLQMALGFMFPQQFGVSVVGASAGVFGLIAAFATHAPDQPITMLLYFVLPVTFPAKFFLLFEAVAAGVGMIWGPSMVAHAAHLGGMLTGILYVGWLKRPARAIPSWGASRPERPREELVRVSKRASGLPRARVEELPASEFISQEVDPILEKISAHGIHSLTEGERRILEAARNKMAKR